MLRTFIKLDVPNFCLTAHSHREPLIDDKDTPIATSFALIVDRNALIVDTKPLITHKRHSKDFLNESRIKKS